MKQKVSVKSIYHNYNNSLEISNLFLEMLPDKLSISSILFYVKFPVFTDFFKACH